MSSHDDYVAQLVKAREEAEAHRKAEAERLSPAFWNWHIRNAHKEEIKLGIWDGGNDSGYFEVNSSVFSEDEEALADLIEDLADKELGYGSWAGEFSSSGIISYIPARKEIVLAESYRGGKLDVELDSDVFMMGLSPEVAELFDDSLRFSDLVHYDTLKGLAEDDNVFGGLIVFHFPDGPLPWVWERFEEGLKPAIEKWVAYFLRDEDNQDDYLSFDIECEPANNGKVLFKVIGQHMREVSEENFYSISAEDIFAASMPDDIDSQPEKPAPLSEDASDPLPEETVEPVFSLRRVPAFSGQEFVRLLKTHYDSLEECLREANIFKVVDGEDEDSATVKLLKAKWDSAKRYELADRESFNDSRQRLRVFFWALRPERLFRAMPHETLDKADIECERVIWDAFGKPEKVKVTRHYELLSIDGADFGYSSNVVALEMTCPTTGKKHMLLVPPFVHNVADALKRIIPEANPTHRQGDVLVKSITEDLDKIDEEIKLAKDETESLRVLHKHKIARCSPSYSSIDDDKAIDESVRALVGES